jgi:hypothetical protein
MEGYNTAKIVVIALNRDFNHSRIRSTSDHSFSTVTCAFSRADTNELRLFVICATFVESERDALLILLASFVVSGPSYFKLY